MVSFDVLEEWYYKDTGRGCAKRHRKHLEGDICVCFERSKSVCGDQLHPEGQSDMMSICAEYADYQYVLKRMNLFDDFGSS